MQVEHLYDKYKGFVQDLGVKHRASDTELGMQLKKMVTFKKDRPTIKEGSTSSRKSCYTFQSLAECRSDFDKFINSTIEWPIED